MKLNLYKYFIRLTLLALTLGLVLSGCSYYVKPVPTPLTIPEIIKLCMQHVPSLFIDYYSNYKLSMLKFSDVYVKFL